jgi:hypothetical protein
MGFEKQESEIKNVCFYSLLIGCFYVSAIIYSQVGLRAHKD